MARPATAAKATPGGEPSVRRKIRSGVLGALAAVATLYTFGVVGLLIEWLTGRPAVNSGIALVGLALALSVGVLVLHRLPQPAERHLPPANPDSPGTVEPGSAPDRSGR